MSSQQFSILIIVIVVVGGLVAFGPRFLDQRQAKNDKSFDCIMFRLQVDTALEYYSYDMTDKAMASLREADGSKEKGNCSDYRSF